MRWRRWATTWLLPLALGACGGNGCSGCSEIVPQPKTPAELLIGQGAQVRLTQHGFDVIADNIVALMKALFGTAPGGAAKIDVDQLLPGNSLAISGGLGLFKGKASVRELVLTLDLAKLTVKLVEGSSPARIRVAVTKADLGVLQGIVAGEADFLGIKSNAACHLLNGVDIGKPNERIATVSATIDLVLGVDSQGKLDIKAEVSDPVLHDIGFRTKQDCGLKECKDQVLLEDPCLECGICATGKLTSDVVAAMAGFLKPVLSDLLQLAANLLIKGIIEPGLNGKPLDVELPVDLPSLLASASPEIGALLADGNPLRIRARPAPKAFAVDNGGLNSKLDAAAFAQAHGCVVSPGPDKTDTFVKLTQSPPPDLPQTMSAPTGDGQQVSKPLDAGALLARSVVEEAVWAVLRSGTLCTSVDAEALYTLSGDRIVLVAGLIDLALPGLRQIVPPDAPLRLTLMPTASVDDVPRAKLATDGQGGAIVRAELKRLGMRVEAAMTGRWLTLLELDADAVAVIGLRIDAQGRLVATIADVEVPRLEVAQSALFPKAQLDVIAGPLADLGLSLLLGSPMVFDVDLKSLLESALKLPIDAQLIGIQVGGTAQDWLVLGIALAAKAVTP